MTIVEHTPEMVAAELVVERAPAPTTTRRPVPIVVSLVCMVVALATCWALLALTEGPFGSAWYHNRQGQLAGNLMADLRVVGPGEALGVLQIPRLRINLVVQEGDDVGHLRSGPGHHAGTPKPGQLGNSVIVGHRSGWGAPFGHLALVHVGDLIVFQGRTPNTYVFKVTSVKSGVAASDPAPFAESNDHRLTLITGSGGRFSDRRLVVTAVSGAPAGRNLSFGPPASPTIPGVSKAVNEAVLLIVAGVALGLFVLVLTRRRYSRATAAMLVSPFVALALIGLLLELDFMLPALH